jgi:hypothetical protein
MYLQRTKNNDAMFTITIEERINIALAKKKAVTIMGPR